MKFIDSSEQSPWYCILSLETGCTILINQLTQHNILTSYHYHENGNSYMKFYFRFEHERDRFMETSKLDQFAGTPALLAKN